MIDVEYALKGFDVMFKETFSTVKAAHEFRDYLDKKGILEKDSFVIWEGNSIMWDYTVYIV